MDEGRRGFANVSSRSRSVASSAQFLIRPKSRCRRALPVQERNRVREAIRVLAHPARAVQAYSRADLGLCESGVWDACQHCLAFQLSQDDHQFAVPYASIKARKMTVRENVCQYGSTLATKRRTVGNRHSLCSAIALDTL